ncbi:MAG: DUF2865 domain-containing protein [Hoeflea sp.]|uniref:DUF2865 domain-containing protein n=1 Tax=Hoeflea sp. TaxID=1940281 RepID=UPI001DF4E76B|nr:DUF2865 domain-containing protein [Hoeflea sp.]MBU4530457.1 DUF2865 domain-containing protein [Alphaproteobacteria bacterium]MBU4545244.1 DUF2865 domain-containing protein [Alphaproteobacteria bacterium]MBU4549556.1 DUF2865 domain-containing protein [Alphaproteobacteria bacterium]MBV1722047.1 DUF2865 domain-containing protein [Hoeflea sp.]MBV1761397.1 DUF2865 domain-containing protein [Hoeflea sp.]
MRRVRVRSFMLVVVLALAGTGAAEASAVCTQLKAQLASASRSDSSANYQRYANAVQKQETQIRQVQSDLKRFGCTSGSIIVLGGRNAEACAKLTSAHKKMRVNLAALERKRDSHAKRDTKVSTRRIEAALKANDCDGTRASIVEAALKGRNDAIEAKRTASPGLVAILGDSGGRQRLNTNSGLSRSNIMVEQQAARGGSYRTLCVRSCDGFFFPVSSRANPSDFTRDERTCQMMCPGTGTELYFHAADIQESEEMVSARTGQPYTEMPNAFVYRNANAPMSKACGCNMGAFYKEMERREAILNGGATQDEAPVTTWVHPVRRPDPGEDPETMLDAEMRLTSEDVTAVLSASKTERPLTEERRQVRVVGPTFLPDESDQFDLKAAPPSLIR